MSESDFDEFTLPDEEEEQFALASAYVTRKADTYDTSDLLEFYAYYKQATDGPCHTERPSMLQMKARSKWNAWFKLGEMSAKDAQRAYVAKLNDLDVNWSDEFTTTTTNKSNSNRKAQQVGNGIGNWVVHSIESMPADSITAENEKTVFDYVKEKNLGKLRETLQPNDLKQLDEHGMGLLHWATDRNAVDIIEFLIECGGNVNVRDGEQQTPLHYASSCGHLEALHCLLKWNADKELCDDEGQTCLDVAENEHIHAILTNS